MPRLNVTTKSSQQIWASPDGQRKIYELLLDYQGKTVKAKTYSNAIASQNWSGEVELYEKPGRNGVETFVKQPPKEGGYGKSAKPQVDPFTMFLSYAKDIAVALINTKAYTLERLSEIVSDVAVAGEQLYDARPDNPNRDKVEPVKGDETPAELSDNIDQTLPGQLTPEDITSVFGGGDG